MHKSTVAFLIHVILNVMHSAWYWAMIPPIAAFSTRVQYRPKQMNACQLPCHAASKSAQQLLDSPICKLRSFLDDPWPLPWLPPHGPVTSRPVSLPRSASMVGYWTSIESGSRRAAARPDTAITHSQYTHTRYVATAGVNNPVAMWRRPRPSSRLTAFHRLTCVAYKHRIYL